MKNLFNHNRNDKMVSIIMPAFNVSEFVQLAVESVIGQTHKDWELIICDDNSSDGTLDIVRRIQAKEDRIILIKNSYEKGAPGARNSAIEKANGRYIAFLDADDLWFPEKLEKQVNCIQRSNALMVHSDYCLMTEAGVSLDKSVVTPDLVTRRKMMIANFLPCLTVMYDSERLGKYHQPNIERRNDYALWLNMFNNNDNLISVKCPGVLAKYRVNSYGLSSKPFLSLKYHWLALVGFGGYNLAMSTALSAFYLSIVVLKKKFPNLYNLIIKKI